MSIRKRESKKAKNGYVFEVFIKYVDYAGNKKRISKSGFLTKKEAQIYEAEKKKEISENVNIKTKKYTFNDIFNLYINNDPFTKDSTKYCRLSTYNKHLKNTLGPCDISKLDYEYIQNFFNEKAKVETKTLIENIYRVVNGVFTYAYNNNYIIRKPYVKLKLNGLKTLKKKNTITIDEFKQFIDNYSHPNINKKVEYDNYIVALYIGLYTGIRLGECLGIKKEDVDMINRNISINKQLQIIGSDIRISELKTNSSYRKVPISDELYEILKEHFKKYPESEFVICDKDMGCMSPRKIQKSIQRASQKLNIDFHYHMLRHTFITQLYNNGVDIKVTQLLAGHSSYKTTADIYTELDNEKTSNFQTTNLYN